MREDIPEQDLITAAFDLAAREGWPAVSVAAAARHAGLPLEDARGILPSTDALLLRFGRHADRQALNGAPEDGPARERLFDILMRRIDALQQHRAGVLALLAALPGEPRTALLLAAAMTASMGWMLEGAGIASTGLPGRLRAQGLVAVWLAAIRAWQRDDSADLSSTMAALDRALGRAERAASWLHGSPLDPSPTAAGPKPFPEGPAPLSPATTG